MLNVNKINKKNIAEGRKLRAERLSRLAWETACLESGQKLKQADFSIKPSTIPQTDIVFRIMTWDHIPLDEDKTKRARMTALGIDDEEEYEEIHTEYDDPDGKHNKYVRVNFPPFQHYRVNEEGEPILVGKSHWIGGMVRGKFSKDHGQMTPKLAHMFIKLCERYGTRSNWRSYTYNDEMRSQALLQLSQIGLQFDESKSQNPFAYYTATITNSFTRVLNIEKRNQNIRDDILEMNGLNPSYTRQSQRGWSAYSSGSPVIANED